MQFITSLFGGTENSILTVVFALGIVLVLIVLAVWLLKLLFSASGNVARGRNRRLSVSDSLAVDQKRQLLIVRRDNVEHLVLIGGPQDVVIETGIAVDETALASGRRQVPMLGRKPAPVTAPPAKAVVPEPVVGPAATIEHLGEAASQRSARSLRHTGLMRSVDPAVNAGNSDKPAPGATDSAKEDSAQQDVEGTDLGEGETKTKRK
ncbi:hypothetical protein GCM10007913_09500 [Devosia yakushimensis]|uniref:Flagellar biosynthesis protein, FliO n=1 Tax=Devosia yakushimensis TaxID=470028 RepID=A0ABQ5UCT1_9HYPH|nr:flagellar biosynthetic protein FliO [Devosia yakushimensis]GLQ09018.1 hypothetical protein GCM10007913_09500 [Devosia yakushimensis]